MKKYFFFLLFSVYGVVFSQNTEYQIYTLDKFSVERNSNSYKIISELALANNVDLRKTKLNFQTNFKYNSVIQDNGKIKIDIRPELISLKGETHYRKCNLSQAFANCTYVLNLTIIRNNSTILSQTVLCPASGIEIEPDLPLRFFSFAGTTISIKLLKIVFDNDSYDVIYNKMRQVDAYYSLNELLKIINKEFKNKSSIAKPEDAEELVNYQEFIRIENFALKNSISKQNSILWNDPLDFFSKYSTFLRYGKRFKTLTNNIIQGGLKSGFTQEKALYVDNVISLSEKFYKQSKKFQPNTSSAFKSTIEVNNDELEFIEKVHHFYDELAYGENLSIPQMLFNKYISKADEYHQKSKDNMALALIRNARRLSQKFNIEMTDEYVHTTVLTLNDMIGAYISVSNKALASGKLDMAETYYSQAEELFDDNRELFKLSGIALTPYNTYVDAQIKKAKELMSSGQYYSADNLLRKSLKLSKERNLDYQQIISKLFITSRQGIFDDKLSKLQESLKTSTDSAYYQLYELMGYKSENKDFLKTPSDEDLAYPVFIELIQDAEIMIDKNDEDEAFNKLLKARNIQNEYLKYRVDRVDNLLAITVKPKILELLLQARLDIWAGRGGESDLNEAIKLQNDYNLLSDKEINTEINKCYEKLNGRECLDKQFQIKSNCNEFARLASKGYFSEATSLIKTSWQIIDENPNCKLQTNLLDSLSVKYSSLIDYSSLYDKMKANLFGGNYMALIPAYNDMRSFYFDNNLSELNIKTKPLNDFVKSQNLPGLTRSCIDYYTNKNQYLLALEYLDILRQQKVSAKNARETQELLAQNMLKSNNYNRNFIEEIINDLSDNKLWYKYFIKEISKKN